MDASIIQQVTGVEAEADGVIEQARREAAEADAQLPKQIEQVREQHAEGLDRRVAELRAKLQKRTAERTAAIEQNAQKAMAQLESLDAEAVEGAVAAIAQRLREDA